MQRFKFLSLMLAATAALGACSDDEGEGFNPSNDANIRVVNAATGAPTLDVLLDNNQIADNLAYGQGTSYTTVQGGTPDMVVGTDFSGESTELLTTPFPITGGATYTVVIGGSAEGGVTPYVIPDDAAAPPTGQAKFRVLNFAASAPAAVDVFVTAPGADLSTASPTFSAVGYGDPTSYATLAPGTYQVRVAPQLSREAVIDAGTVQLNDGDSRTAIAIDAPTGGEPFGAILLDDRRP
jgi:hypothetical protein